MLGSFVRSCRGGDARRAATRPGASERSRRRCRARGTVHRRSFSSGIIVPPTFRSKEKEKKKGERNGGAVEASVSLYVFVLRSRKKERKEESFIQ